jgi:hypothetical protein
MRYLISSLWTKRSDPTPMTVFLIFSLTAQGFLFKNDLWQGFKTTDEEKKTIKFAGISFKVLKSLDCKALSSTQYQCSSNNFSFTMEERKAPNKVSLGLVRLLRKDEWLKKYKIFRYQEANIDLFFGKSVLQEASFYHISQIVLLRSFDIMLEDNKFISVEEKINMQDWPLIKDQIHNIELSIII